MKQTELVLEQYRKAAEKFIAKVESGRAHSVETYADLEAALEAHRRLRENNSEKN